MATGYVRQSAGSIVPGNAVRAAHMNDEFNAIVAAFHETTGHTHDGTAAGGAKIPLATAVSGTLPIANGGTGATSAAAALTALGAASAADLTTGLATKLASTGGTAINTEIRGYRLTRTDLGSASGSRTIDLSLGNYFQATSGGVSTWTFSNVPSGTVASGFVLELTNGGASAQTWPASVKWPSGTAPTLTSAGVDVLVFITDDNGTTWRGMRSMADSK